MMTRFVRGLLVGAAVALAALSCDDSAGLGPTDERQASELNFLRPAPGAPEFADTTVTFYAKRGEDRQVRIRYAVAPGEFEEFVRFRVRDDALVARPDGTPIAEGDSVLITVRVVDFSRLIVEFQPSGLRFSQSEPAELTFKYNHTDPDRDGDGDVDANDSIIETQLAVWRQEAPGQPWFRMPSKIEISIDEVEVDIRGFTGYALAY
ncbi:MAG: hypothetical protein ABR499_01200 [Gemmatimonadaceae bacterium]